MPYKCSRCERLYSADKIGRHLCWSRRRRLLVAAALVLMVVSSVWMLN